MGRSAKRRQREPWYGAGLTFRCTACGQCCTGEPGHVWLTSDEIRSMARARKLSEREFRRRFVRKVRGRLSLRERQNGDCVMLEAGRCTVYDAKPTRCTTFPFWKPVLEDPIAWDEAAARCEGIGQGDRYSREEIETMLGGDETPLREKHAREPELPVKTRYRDGVRLEEPVLFRVRGGGADAAPAAEAGASSPEGRPAGDESAVAHPKDSPTDSPLDSPREASGTEMLAGGAAPAEAPTSQDVAAGPDWDNALLALEGLYRELAAELPRYQFTCAASGNCCDFDAYGHRLYVTTLEAEHFFRHQTERVNDDTTQCPAWGADRLCKAREGRMLGCRTYFCGPYAVEGPEGLHERFQARLLRLHDQFNIPYQYRDIRAWSAERLDGQEPI